MQRHQYWDILKGLGILAIVIGHSGSPLIPFVYMYHITLFFFISGCLYKDTHSAKPITYVVRRIRSLYWPFVKYGIGLLIFHNLLLHINILSAKVEPDIITTSKYNMRDMIGMAKEIVTLGRTEQMVGAMWFIPVLFIACISFCLIRYVSIKFVGKYSLLVTGGISITLFVVGIILAQKHVLLPRHTDVAFVVLPIFLAGYLLNSSGIQVFRHWGIALFCAVFLVFVSRKYGFFQLDNRMYINPWLFITASFAGIYMNLYLGKVIENISFLGKWIAYIGRRSLMIMALHFLAFKIVSAIYMKANKVPDYWLAKFPVITGSNGWWIVYTLTGVGIPLVLSAMSASFKERFLRPVVLDK